jgi:radical SAM protein (TIGR01212 family)
LDSSRLTKRLNLIGPWLKDRFGGRVVKLPLDSGVSCPNRDGSIGYGGCAFCPPSGSGTGKGSIPLARQIEAGLERVSRQAAIRKQAAPRTLAYYQAYSTTHVTAPRLSELLAPALESSVDGLIISTRPDCLDEMRWEVLAEAASHKPLWLELGLQSSNNFTLFSIGRGHDFACFVRALKRANQLGINVVAHVILGLPGESAEHTSATAQALADLGVWGVKMHQLMVLEGARLAGDYNEGRFQPWSREYWAKAAADFLGRLPAETTIHRLVADPGFDKLIAPDWASDKQAALEVLASELECRDLRQGDLCRKS